MRRRRLAVGLSAAILMVVCGAVLWGLSRRANGEEQWYGDVMDWWDWSKAEAMITVEAQAGLPGLHRAAGKGDLEEVKRLLEQGADVNSGDADGWTPLHWAAYEGKSEVVEFLLGKGADREAQAVEPGELNWLLNTDFIRAVPPEQWTSLHKRHNATPLKAALAKGRKEAVDLLMDPSLDQKGKDELLVWAVRWRYAGGASILAGRGADVNGKDEYDWRPLHWAARNHDPHTVEALLRAGADPNARTRSRQFRGHHMMVTTPEGQTPLLLGANEPEVVRPLVEAGADVKARDADGTTAVHEAGWSGAAIEILIAHGAEVDARDGKGETPLMGALAFYEQSGRDALVAHGADVNAKDGEGKSLLNRGLGYSRTDTAKWLLDHGADPNGRDNDGRTPLHDVAAASWWANGVEYATLLLERGADAGAKDASGATPLELAVREENREVALFLRERTAASEGGPLHRAAAAGDLEDVRELLNGGAEVNATNEMGLTPLHLAVTGGHREVVELLVAKGADVNAADRFGWTPLHNAAWEGELMIGEALIEHGAKVDARAKDEETPLHLAVRKAQVGIVTLLLDRGADPNAKGAGGTTPLEFAYDAAGADGVHESGEAADDIIELLEECGAEW